MHLLCDGKRISEFLTHGMYGPNLCLLIFMSLLYPCRDYRDNSKVTYDAMQSEVQVNENVAYGTCREVGGHE